MDLFRGSPGYPPYAHCIVCPFPRSGATWRRSFAAVQEGLLSGRNGRCWGMAGSALRDAQKSLLMLCSLSPLLLLSLFYGGYFVCVPDPANKLSGFFIAAVILCSILETGTGFPSCFLLPFCIPSDDICKAVQNFAKQALLFRQSWRRLFLYSSAFGEYASAEGQSPMVSWLLLPKAFAVFLMRFLRIQISVRYPDSK